MSYRVDFPNDSVEKKFEKVLLKISPPNLQDKIMDAIETLAHNPRPFGEKPFKRLNPPVECYRFTARYRIRISSYRVLYDDVDDKNRIVWIMALKKRDERTYKR
ncbi:MAG: type II toxin-antitoxin system RelE/ParE family toxin [Candidatus Omnitrophota bacterium]|nr:type II toxin-antitoxin system RelE/ParE family toxin [Candidatus Omnitrophota bacterium]